jgi:hypothetical protein
MKKQNMFYILIVFTLFLGGCKYDFVLPETAPPVTPGGDEISFQTQILPILSSKCLLCHNTQAPVMTSSAAYSQLVPKYVNAASPASSKLYTIPTSGTHGGKFTTAQAALVLQWITEGAKNN